MHWHSTVTFTNNKSLELLYLHFKKFNLGDWKTLKYGILTLTDFLQKMGNTSTRTGCWHLEVDAEGKGEKVKTILYFGRKAIFPLCPVNPATPRVCLKENSKSGALVRCWPGIKTILSSKLLDSKTQGWDFSPLCQCVKSVRGGPGAMSSPLSWWYDGNVGNN